MHKYKLLRLGPKLTIAVLLFLAIFQAWKKGYFKDLRQRQKLSLKPYAVLLITFPLLIAALLPFDEFMLHAVQSWSKHFIWVVEFGRFIGGNVTFWAFLVAVYFLCGFFRRELWGQRILGVILGSVATALVCHGMKFLFMRARPYTGHSPLDFFNLSGFMTDYRAFQSFPSGDVALVGGGASYIFYANPNRRLRWLVFLLPLATAIARVSLNRHWVSDTVGSFWLSLIVCRGVWNYFHTER